MAKRTIVLDIAKYNLGSNTDEDNEAYRIAVQEEIEAQYPGADVEVNIISGISKDVANCNGFPDAEANGDAEETVLLIAQDVWCA